MKIFNCMLNVGCCFTTRNYCTEFSLCNVYVVLYVKKIATGTVNTIPVNPGQATK